MSGRLYDIDILARTIWAEARGEGRMGMEAVANVILNRQKDGRWPDNVTDVCQQRRQFSCWNSNDPNRFKLELVDHSDPAFALAYAIAAMAVAGMLEDRTNGANHYLTTKLFESSSRPSWADPESVTASIGNHVFLRLPS